MSKWRGTMAKRQLEKYGCIISLLIYTIQPFISIIPSLLTLGGESIFLSGRDSMGLLRYSYFFLFRVHDTR